MAGADSVHPPLARDGDFNSWLDHALEADVIVEVMYPGWFLGNDEQVAAALDAGLPLAVDVAHVYLQRCQGSLTEATAHRLLESERIREVHVSSGDGKADRHWLLDASTYGVGWARERAAAGVAVVCESYLHRVQDPAAYVTSVAEALT
jgi:hypothetical protein